MIKSKTFIFVSIDGMTDPLGQSQVLPYLVGLSKLGYAIMICSCEKQQNWQQHKQRIENITKESNIIWKYNFYQTGKPFLSQWLNYKNLRKLVLTTILEHPSNYILHCRSYIAGLIGLHAQKKHRTKFIFDMRGFWADERIEGNIWAKTNPIGFILYNLFKKKEKEMLINADAIITLTERAKDIILNWKLDIPEQKITVIPCCADLSHFSSNNLSTEHFQKIKSSLPNLNQKLVICYVGSLGTWYLSKEMIEFFAELRHHTPSHFLIITKDDKKEIELLAKTFNIPSQDISIVSSSRNDMPYYMALAEISIFFIKPSFSKTASSPTKMGELLSMGIPVITNTGIGDVDTIIRNYQCGVSISEFNLASYQHAIQNILENRTLYKQNAVKTAQATFSLNDGIKKYNHIYQHI